MKTSVLQMTLFYLRLPPVKPGPTLTSALGVIRECSDTKIGRLKSSVLYLLCAKFQEFSIYHLS